MTCLYCEEDTAHRDTYVTYGGVIFCDYDCLAHWYVEAEVSTSISEYVEAEVSTSISEIELSSKVIEQ